MMCDFLTLVAMCIFVITTLFLSYSKKCLETYIVCGTVKSNGKYILEAIINSQTELKEFSNIMVQCLHERDVTEGLPYLYPLFKK